MPGIFVTLLLTCLSSIRAQDTASFTYKELNRGVLSVADFLVVHDRGGYAISVSLTKNKERIRQELVCDSTFATIRWSYVSDANTDISFRRIADRIEVRGTFQGKAEKKDLSIDNHPWYQIVPLGLQTVSRDSSGRSKLWAVSLQEPAVLKAVCFCVVGTTNASLPGHPEIACQCFHMKIEGLPSGIWGGDYFIRQSDHVFLYFEGHLFGSKKPTGTIEAEFHKKG